MSSLTFIHCHGETLARYTCVYIKSIYGENVTHNMHSVHKALITRENDKCKCIVHVLHIKIF